MMIVNYPLKWFVAVCSVFFWFLIVLVFLVLGRIVSRRIGISVIYNTLNSILNFIGDILIKIIDLMKTIINDFVKG